MSKQKILDDLDYWTVFGKKLVELMDLTEGAQMLDIGTGGGACLIPAAKKIGLTGHIIGIDLWENSIKEVTDNIKLNGLENASAEIMDARSLIYKDESFDYITSGFIGFNNEFDFVNHQYRKKNTKLNNFYRVLKSGGKVGISTWLEQEDLECLRTLIQSYLENYTNSTKEEIQSVPISYSKESIKGFHKIMDDAGFRDIEIFAEEFVLHYQSVEEWFNMMKRVGWILRRVIGPEENKILDFKEKMLPHGLDSYKKKDGYFFTKTVLFIFGIK